MGAQGTVIVDFGAAPGTNVVSNTVTGQTGIVATSSCECWFQGSDSTADHTAYEHEIAPLSIICSVNNIVPGTGFTVNLATQLRITKTWQLRWVWN